MVNFFIFEYGYCRKKLRHTFAEYLALEEEAVYQSEFSKGKIFPISGGTADHSLIGANCCAELNIGLKEEDCQTFNSELMIRIETAESAVYPDAIVICGPRDYFEGRKNVVTNPIVIVEILSESSASYDRGGKFRKYELLPSLQEYVLIEQKEAQIEVFRRKAQGLWELARNSGLDAKVQLHSLGIEISNRNISIKRSATSQFGTKLTNPALYFACFVIIVVLILRLSFLSV